MLFKVNKKYLVALFAIILIQIILYVIVEFLYYHNASLILAFVRAITKNQFFIYILILPFIIYKFAKKQLLEKEDQDELIKQKSIKPVLIIILCILFFCVLVPPAEVRINNKRPGILIYQCYIVKDMIEGETTTISVKSKKIDTNAILIYAPSQTHTNRHSLPKTYYVRYYVTDTYQNSSPENMKVVSIIDSLKGYEDEVAIEYYNNSGIIKSIDGIDKNDYEALKERRKMLEKETHLF